MADTKISALVSATTPLAGTEVIPLVQGTTTVKVPVSDLTAGRAVSALSVTASTIGAGSGANLSLQSNAATKATIDTSGNFGLGVTPSAWGGGAIVFDIYQGSLAAFSSGTNLASNYYFNGTSNIYKTSQYALIYALNHSTGSHIWYTAPSGTAGNTVTFTQAMKLDSSGNLLITSTGGLGYGTGSGGAVTQITSRTTGVTLDKTNGAITLVSAAGSTTWQSFTVTNSKVAATDVVHVCQKSGTDLNEIHVTNVSAGSFQITFRTTGGTTTEQPVFSFSVIKAVTS